METLQQKISSLEVKIDTITIVILDSNKDIIGAFNTTDANFESIENRLDLMDRHLEIIDEKVNSLASRSNKEFETVEDKIEELKAEVIKIYCS